MPCSTYIAAILGQRSRGLGFACTCVMTTLYAQSCKSNPSNPRRPHLPQADIFAGPLGGDIIVEHQQTSPRDLTVTQDNRIIELETSVVGFSGIVRCADAARVAEANGAAMTVRFPSG